MTATAASSIGTAEVEQLAEEIRRYLEAVETFRREGCEPRWEPEPRARP